jgi:YHS domain-containing protein
MVSCESSVPARREPMVDPVCGMEVERGTAAAAWEHEGTTYLFCSVGCMERFREDPERFLTMDPSDRSM